MINHRTKFQMNSPSEMVSSECGKQVIEKKVNLDHHNMSAETKNNACSLHVASVIASH